MRFKDLRIRMKILLGATSIVLITGMLGVLAYVYIGKISGTLFSITENNAKSVEFATGVERKALETLLAIRFLALPGFPWVTGLRPAGDGGLSRRRRSR